MNIRVHQNTKQQLQFVLRPTGWIYVIAGLVFIGLGVLAMWFLAHQTSLSVNDETARYEKRFLSAWVIKEFAIPVREIADISLELHEGFSPTYRVTFSTAGEFFYADFPMADGDKKREIVDRCNEAVGQSNGGTYKYTESGLIPGLILGGVCIIGGLYGLLSLQTITVSMDRAKQRMTIDQRRWLLPVGTHREIDLAMIERIATKQVAVRTVKHHVSSYQVFVRCVDDEAVPIAAGPMFTENSAAETKKLLEGWLRNK